MREGEPPISLHFSFRSPPNRAAVHDLLRPDVTRYVCYSHYRLRRFSTKSQLFRKCAAVSRGYSDGEVIRQYCEYRSIVV